MVTYKAYEESITMNGEDDLEFLSDDSRYGLIVERKCLQKLLRVCREAKDLEVGGIVMGVYDAKHRYAWVKSISDAPSDSSSNQRWFQRGISGLQFLLDKYWQQRQFYYLGEWHFHPNASAEASAVDIEQMRSISLSAAYNCPEPILVILGDDPKGNWEIRSYVFPRNKTWIELKTQS